MVNGSLDKPRDWEKNKGNKMSKISKVKELRAT
jgi:hypothetical protein